MKFLRSFFATLLALIVFTIGGFMFLSLMIAAFDTEEKVSVADNSLLVINLNKTLADRSIDDPLANFPFQGSDMDRIGVIDIRAALEQAASDDKIKGVVLYAPTLMGGFALGGEVRDALVKFKRSGKFILSYADLMSEGGFYMSSVADELYVSPEGDVEWNGLSMEMMFFKRTFEKLDIEPQIFRVGDFKSAVEPLMLEKMSEASRHQVTSYMNSIYDNMVTEVADNSTLDAEQLLNISDKYLARNVQEAVELELITGAIYKDEFMDLLADKLDVADAEDLNMISFQNYNKSFSRYKSSKNKIAVIIGEGNILMGKGSNGVITSSSFSKEIRKARNDDNVKAIVLRINSPGGDALASDLIWREVIKARESKPVIASFGDVAASGGYYIGMAADTIIAQPNTITGSIGIFAVIFNIGDFMANKLGITSDSESTGEYSGMWTASRALTDGEKAIIQKGVNDGYETFTSKAAMGRGMAQTDLKKIASGRVWTGSQALENGLVDMLGGLDLAIITAAEKANLDDDFKVRYYPEQKSTLEQLMEEFGSSAQAKWARYQLGDMYPYVDVVQKMKNLKGTQALMPFEVVIK